MFADQKDYWNSIHAQGDIDRHSQEPTAFVKVIARKLYLMKKPVTMRVLASVGIFSGTGLVAILGSLSFLNFDIYNKILHVISILSVLIMPFILRGIHVRKISDKTIIQPRCQMKRRRMIRIFDHSGA